MYDWMKGAKLVQSALAGGCMDATIRLATEADAEECWRYTRRWCWKRPSPSMKEPPSPEEFRGRIRAALERRPWLACDAGGDIAGYACASQFNPRESFRG